MERATVKQRPALRRILADLLTRVRPASLLVLGAWKGNGLEHVDRAVTRRVRAEPLSLTSTRGPPSLSRAAVLLLQTQSEITGTCL
jgi:hypothetical protein